MLKKALLIAKSNIKANKGQSLSFLILVIIAAALLNLGIVTYNNSSNNFDIQAEKHNLDDCMIAMQNNKYLDELEDEIKNDSSVSDYEKRDVMLMNTIFKYNDGDQAIRSIVLNKDLSEKYNKTTILEETSEVYDNPVYLPLILKSGGGYSIGDNFTLTSEGSDYNFTVAGFFDNLSLGSTAVPNIGILLDSDHYKEFQNKLNHSADAEMFLIKLNDKNDSTKYICSLYNEYSSKTSDIISTRTHYNGIKNARTFMSNIVAMIIVSFSIVVVLISLVIVRFRIINSIEDDIQGIGALKACGYTSRDIMISYITQFILITLSGSIVGIGLSYILLPILTNSLEMQSGMIYETSFNLSLSLLTLLIILFISIITIYFSTRRIKKLPPIDALRNGFNSHNFKKNHIPLATSKGNANFLLGMKSFLSNIKHNISITAIITLITLASCVILILYYNIAVQNKAFIDAIAGEVPTISLSMTDDNYNEDLINELENYKDVTKAVYHDTLTLKMENDLISYIYVTPDYSDMNTDMCYEGRNPIHSNEIAINGYIGKILNKKIGDEIELIYGDNSEKYIITGFIQSGNNMGLDSSLTDEGIKRINKDYKTNSIFVYLDDNSKADDFADTLKDDYKNKIKDVFCVENLVNAQMKSYIEITKILSVAILLSSLAIISLMLYLIIKTLIIKNKTSYGILKALGYTSKDVMLQLSLSLLPVIIIGSIAGCILGYYLTNSLFALLLRSVGIMKISLNINIIYIIILCLSIIVFGFLIALLVSRKLKKISAIKLIRE